MSGLDPAFKEINADKTFSMDKEVQVSYKEILLTNLETIGK